MQISLKRYLYNIIKVHKAYILGMVVVALYWAIANALSPYTLKLIIDKAAAFQNTDKSELFVSIRPYLITYLLFWLGMAIDMRFLDWLKLRLYPQLRYDIIQTMFQYLNEHSQRYFQNNFAGSLANKINDMHSGAISVFTILDDVFAQSIGLVIAILVMFAVHSIFALILLLWVICFMLITLFYFKPIRQQSNIFAQSKTIFTGSLVDCISNISNTRLFSRQDYEKKVIEETTQDTVDKDRAMQKTILKMRIFWDISILVLISLDICMLVNMYAKNQVSLGDFSFVIGLSVNVFWNLWFLAQQFVDFAQELGRCKQALSILTEAHEIVDKPQAKPLIVSKGRIEFEEVSFHYDEGRHLFKNKSIIIESGQKVGLVGLSGSGKSSFVNLILRLFDLESGRILIDNQAIDTVTQHSLREQIALIPQDISLFHRSLMDNIRYGAINASDQEVIEASKLAHCHEFISELPQTYEALVGERGIKLSGGQRQRIAIARAILKKAPILILDEATSALDSLTEKLIQDSLHNLMQGATTLVIAHRLSTLAKMDRILVFDQGKIIEDGCHARLLEAKGHYFKMWQMQAGGFLPDTL